jgi:3-hydroxyisobutyrate dehydrogenase-like beta-hydroxyacid dehydrogenase
MKKIGFIGLGNVGTPAAINLLSRGFEVHGYDVRPCTPFIAAGGKMEATLDGVTDCGVIVQSLPTAAVLCETVDVLLGQLPPGTIVIELSSYPLEVKQREADRLQERGVVMLDCEVSGLPHQLENRSAVLFKSGDAATIDRCARIFDAITDRHFYLGAFGAATKMKLIANMMVCVHDLVAAEALNLGRAVGLDVAQMIEVLGPSAAGSATFTNKAPLMLSRQFERGRGPFRHMFGYLERAQVLARQASAPPSMPLLTRTQEIFELAKAQGRHDQDIAAIIEVIEGLKAPEVTRVG